MMTLNLSLSLVMTPLFRPHLLALSIRLEQAGADPVFEITERERYPRRSSGGGIPPACRRGLRFAVDDFFPGPGPARSRQHGG
ncbi:hypothetical protein [Salmonella enterica]|uniref:hypothetical protein n=1 Tax=Salmonella enterica TaxID=28901 RepID=UPI001F3E05B4|nr:hypothetical protein [Salmonella enterica]UJV65322.1 hypothetical protein L1971_00625 [Salmonella enterica subsp. enterica serovar Bovismorbificans]